MSPATCCSRRATSTTTRARRQAILNTLLPSARPAFQPLSSDVSGYWLFIVTGLLCAIGVTWLWQRWSRQHAVPPAPATTLAAQWLIVAIAGLAIGWSLASLAAAGLFGSEPRPAAAALALGSLAVSITGCALLLLRTRADSAAAARRLARFVPPAGPGAMLLLGAALMAPFLAPAYLQSIIQCGERCVPKWGPVNVLIGTGVLVALIAGIGLWRPARRRFSMRLPTGRPLATRHSPLATVPGAATALGAWPAALTFSAGSAVAGFLLWLPDPWRPVGDAFGWDRLFHWSYTVLGPTLGILHGGTPGVDIVAHHGLGLPIGIAALVQLGLELTYANLVRVQLIGTVLVFGLLAVLVRLLFGSILWASAAFRAGPGAAIRRRLGGRHLRLVAPAARRPA